MAISMQLLKIQNSIHYAIVDDKHYDRLCKFKWFDTGRGNIYRTEERKCRFNYGTGKWQTFQVPLANEVMCIFNVMYDHWNNNSLDNLEQNLRIATQSQNMMNKSKTKNKTSSKYKGVNFNLGKWRATIKVGYKKLHLGLFKEEVLAALAYDDAALKYFGEFAKTNFPLVMY